MMARYTNKQGSSMRRLRIAIMVLTGFIVLIGVHYVQLISRNNGINAEISELEQKISALQQRNTQSIDLLDYLNSTAYLEEKARKDLGLKKPGEQAVIIQDINIQSTRNDEIENQTLKIATANYQRWFTYFFNN